MKKEELKEIADLAMLELRDEETEKLKEGIEKMLSYFEKMTELDVDGLEPTTHALFRKTALREDKATESGLDGSKLVSAAAEKNGNFIVIPNVL